MNHNKKLINIRVTEKKKVKMEDIAQSGMPLNTTQRRQVEFEQLQLPTHIDRLGIRSFLETLWYPLYFLDFETFQTGVPLYDGLRPYQYDGDRAL